MAEAEPGVAGSLIRQLEADAQRRFVRWDAALWQELCSGPARQLEDGLVGAQVSSECAEAVLTSYLGLACEAIGLGYLYPATGAGSSFVTLAWNELIPQLLPQQAPARMSDILAQCWNMGENLETAPVWLRRIFMRVLDRSSERGLSDLPALVERVSEAALGKPRQKLGSRTRRHWVHLGEDDPRFLPGRLEFLAPCVLAVYDRRDAPQGTSEVPAMGVWLTDPPLALGPLGKRPLPKKVGEPRWDLLEELARADPTATEWREMAVNPWRAAVTLELSQYLVTLHPV